MHRYLVWLLLVGLLLTGGIKPNQHTDKGIGVTNEIKEKTISAEITSSEVPPVPVPTQPKISVQVSYSKQAIISYIYTKSWPGAVAVAVAQCESGLNPYSLGDGNYGGSLGIFQINRPSHPQYTDTQLYDWKTNIDIAYSIWQGRGNFSAWTCFNTGAYRKYL